MTKYAIVTGASPSSIGFLAAKKLASSKLTPNDDDDGDGDDDDYGYKVILACRDEQKGKEAEALIRAAASDSDVVYLPLDLASFESIHQFVKEVQALDDGAIVDPTRPESSLCLLVNNAGIGFGRKDLTPYQETSDGLEEIVGVNHFGTFLLTQLLLNDLKRSSPDGGRIVVVSSSLHHKKIMGDKKLDPAGAGTSNEADDEKKDINEETKDNDDNDDDDELLLPNFPEGIFVSNDQYDGKMAYKISKLCNLWFTYELQRRLLDEVVANNNDANSSDNTPSVVRVNAISPGFIPSTGLTRRSGVLGGIFLKFVLDPFRYLGMGITRSPEEGAETIVQACLSDEANHGGQYFTLPKGTNQVIIPTRSSNESMDATKAKQLWELSLKTCKISSSSYL